MSNFNPIVLMRNNFLKIGVLLAISGIVASSASAAPTGMVTLGGHVPRAISRLNLQPTGDLPATNVLHLAIGLPLHDTAGLSNLLSQIYDPSSPNYRHFLTPDQFTARFGPTEQDYAAVSNFATANGLAVTGLHRSRLLLDVAGKASDIENALHVKFHIYRHPTENRDFFAPDTEPSLPASLPVLHVSGLDNYSIPHPLLHPKPANHVSPSAGSGPGGTYIGSDFRNAYVPGSSLTGSGQNVALLQFDAFYPSDIAAYENLIGLTGPGPQLVVVPVDGGVPVPTPIGNDEVSLDIEMILSMAPGVSQIYVYEAPNPSPWVDILSKIADDDAANQVSSSWGGGEEPNPSAELIFEQMALQGQSFFQASGDNDAYIDPDNPIPFPSDSPHITVVGGTTLTTGTGGAYSSETVWNWGIEYGDDGIGSSGGISDNFPIPSWQTNINMRMRGGSPTARNIPDVALTADNVYVLYGAGQSGDFGGTSCAAPLWNGFTALVNQLGTGIGHGSVGFLNPALYNLANSANYSSDFNDITTGNNEWSGSPNFFVALRGYDLCTGLGTPGTNLINDLAVSANGLTHLSPPPAPYGSAFAALSGGDPNGNWNVFIVNDSSGDSGMVSNGWHMTLTLADPVGFAADNALTMSATAGPVATNQYGVFTLSITNYGPSTSSNVVVNDTLPVGVTFISANATAGVANHVGASVTWTLGNLTNFAGGQLLITIQPQSSGSFLNSAVVSAETPDPNPDDDTAYATISSSGGIPSPLLSAIGASAKGGFQFYVGVPVGETNVVQGTTNLLTGPWTPLYTNVGPFTFTNSYLPNTPAMFFRDVILP